MIRFWCIAGIAALSLGLMWFSGGQASDPPDELTPLKKLNPDAGDEKKPDIPREPRQGKEPPLEKLQPLDPKEPPQPKKEELELDIPLKPLKEQGQAEDPKEVIARVIKNMEASEDHLKKGKADQETQDIQKKIIEDLEKLINQEKEPDCDCEKGDNQSKKQDEKTQKDQEKKPGSQNQKNGETPQNAKNQKSNDQKKPGPAQQKQEPIEVTQQPGQDPKEKSGALDLKNGKGEKDDQDDNTISSLVKDIWGHLPKSKRLEMDAYSNEQFMPQYEQLLRQYYQTIAAQAKNKEGD